MYLKNGRFSFIFFLYFLCFSLFAYSSDSDSFVFIDDVVKDKNVAIFFDENRNIGEIKSIDKLITFMIDCDFVLVDYKYKVDIDYIKFREGKIVIGPIMTNLINDEFKNNLMDSYRVKAIVIDPGHGGRDPGTVSQHLVNGIRVREKDYVLEIANGVTKELIKKLKGIDIIETRSVDKTLKLKDRSDIANNIKVSENEVVLFISFHANASINSRAKGFEVWVMPSDINKDVLTEDQKKNTDSDSEMILQDIISMQVSNESNQLAYSILNNLDKNIGSYTNNRGIREEQYFVVRETRMPAVLIELGFLSNLEEVKNMLKNDYKKILINSIVLGIIEFVEDYQE